MASSAGGNDHSDNMLKAAQQVWDMLDHLAVSNPKEYEEFVKKQMKEGEDVLSVPEPVFCLRCTLNGGKMRYLYVNVCKWVRVPRPKTDNYPIPVKGGILRHLLYKDSKRKTKDLLYDVAFHPHVLEECMKERGMEEMLISLCLDYVEHEVEVNLAERTLCKKMEVSHKGPRSDIRSSIDEQWRGLLRPECKLDIGESILSEIRDMKAKTDREEKTVLPNLKIFPDRHPKRETPQQKTSPLEAMTMEPRPGENPKKLIEELRSDVVESYRETKDGGCVCVPEHSVSMTGGEGGRGGVINVRVVLPGVGNVKDVDLEVSEMDLSLSVSSKYQLELQFPELVNDELTEAKFNSKQSVLSISLPCMKKS